MSYDNYDLSEYDPYCIEGSTCLTNKLGLTDTSALNQAEQEISAIAMIELDDDPVTPTFDLPHLQGIHLRLFGDVYPWAGEVRCTEIGKSGKLFLPYQLIQPTAQRIFADLHGERCLQGLDLPDFVGRAGYYLGVINCMHPFREGNGRAQRIFINQLADAAGFTVEWSGISGEAMAAACREARMERPDYTNLIKLLRIHTAQAEIPSW